LRAWVKVLVESGCEVQTWVRLLDVYALNGPLWPAQMHGTEYAHDQWILLLQKVIDHKECGMKSIERCLKPHLLTFFGIVSGTNEKDWETWLGWCLEEAI
jgi:hypothetical protein